MIVLPTETVYGLACRPEHVARIFAIKARPADKNVQLLAPDASWLRRVGRPNDAAIALAEAFWPGPLTLVVPAGEEAPGALAVAGTIGVRVPNHPVALEILARTRPLAASSANISGEPEMRTIAQMKDRFGGAVGAYVDGGTIEGLGSTVVDLSHGEVSILREGGVGRADVEAVVAEASAGPI